MIVVQVLHLHDALRRRLPCRDALQKAEIPGSLNAGGDDDQQIRIGSRDGEGVYPAGGTTISSPPRGRDPLSGVIRWQLSAPPVALLSAYSLRGHQRAAGSSSPASLLRGFATDLAWLLASHAGAVAGPVPGR